MPKNLRFLALAILATSAASAQTVVGITETDSLFTFQAGTPGTVINKQPITGLIAGQTIAGIDYRPATGELYAIGYNAGTNAAFIH